MSASLSYDNDKSHAITTARETEVPYDADLDEKKIPTPDGMKKDVSLLFLFLPPTDQHAIATDECGCCVLLSQLHTVEIQEVSDDLVVLPQDIEAVYERAMALTADEVTEILELAWTEHHDDVRGYFPYRPVAQNRSLFELTGLPLVLVALLLFAAKLPLCRASQVGVFPLRNRIHSRELRRAVSGLLSTHTPGGTLNACCLSLAGIRPAKAFFLSS
jgi:hypothetical protein